MLKLLLKIICIAAMIANSTGSSCLCPAILAKGQALRPMAVKSASAGSAEEEPNALAPSGDDEKSAQERSDDIDLLMALSSPGGQEVQEPAEVAEPSTALDAKMAKRRAQRGGAAADRIREAEQGVPKEASISTDEIERKLSQQADNKQFMDFWEKQAKGDDSMGGVAPEEEQTGQEQLAFQRELARGGGTSLGAPEHLASYFEIEAARGELAREAGVSTTRKIAKIRLPLAEVDDPSVLFNKATGYLFYAAQIGCDRDITENLRDFTLVSKNDGDKLKRAISGILELIAVKVKGREKIERVQEQLPGVRSPAELFKKANSYLDGLSLRGYDADEIERLRAKISDNQGKVEELREIILEILTLLEMKEESQTIPFPRKTWSPQKIAYEETTINVELPFQIRRVKAALESFRKRWTGKLVTATSRTSKVPITYLPLLLKQAQALKEEKAADFYDIAFRNLTLFDIIRLDEKGVREYIIIGTTHRGEFEYILKPLEGGATISKGRTRLVKGYPGSIKALRVKGFEGVSVLREYLDFTIEPPRAIEPGSLNAYVKIDSAA